MPEFEIPPHLEEMWIAFTASVNTVSAKQALTLTDVINRMNAMGMSRDQIRANLVRDLMDGGQIFGDFRKNFKTTMKWGIEETARRESISGLDLEKELWEWVAVADNRVCDDCAERNGMDPQSYAEWEAMGLPAAGATVCDANCRCRLLIAQSIEKPEGEIVLNR